MVATKERLSRASWICLAVATVFSAVLLLAGFLVPVYEEASVSSSGEVLHGSLTLVGVNGLGVAFVLAIPLLVTLAVGCALRLGSRAAVRTAWVLTGLLAAFNVLALLSIGVFILPITLALVVACALRRYPGLSRRTAPA